MNFLQSNLLKSVVVLSVALSAASAQAPKKDHTLGYDDTPFIPGQKWRVHDNSRPHPVVVTPAAQPGAPPSDAIVLFDGKDFSKWAMNVKGQQVEPTWGLVNGCMETRPGSGSIVTREKFGDVQLHLEWASPNPPDGKSQSRGNSGVILMSRYEIQVLDSYKDLTYADGQAASMYGQYPPLVNACRPPGEWQTYDIFFEAPKFEGDKLVKPAYVTVIHNGILMHHRQAFLGTTPHAKNGVYKAHGAEESLMLQNHGSPVHYRNIWVRRLKGYDEK
jgi:hypothetical protein